MKTPLKQFFEYNHYETKIMNIRTKQEISRYLPTFNGGYFQVKPSVVKIV